MHNELAVRKFDHGANGSVGRKKTLLLGTRSPSQASWLAITKDFKKENCYYVYYCDSVNLRVFDWIIGMTLIGLSVLI